MTIPGRIASPKFDLLGVRFAINIFIGATVLWLLIRSYHLDPMWAITSMIAASEPKLPEALKFFLGTPAQRRRGLRHRPGDPVRGRHERVEDTARSLD